MTRDLAGYLVSATFADLPSTVRKEAARSLLNWVGCAIGGSRHAAIDSAISALAPFSGPRYGWANVLSLKRDYNELTRKLGETYEIMFNTYKPFACGVVMHATIDGCIQLRNEHKLTADKIDRVELKVHPLVMQLTSKKTPQTGLEGKFSIYHAAGVAFIEGAGGVDQFSDRAVRDAGIASLRDRVSATIDSTLDEDQVRISVATRDGQHFEKFVEHAVGSVDHPMSDSALEAKFAGLAEGILPADRQRRLMDFCWNITALTDVSVLPKAAVIS